MLVARGYPLHLIPHLNRFLVRTVLLKPRDEHGLPLLRHKAHGRPKSAYDDFADSYYRRFGLAEHRIRALWDAWQTRMKGRNGDQQKRNGQR